MQILNFGRVDGLTPEELAQLQELTNIYNTQALISIYFQDNI